jgi:hypothetical protein
MRHDKHGLIANVTLREINSQNSKQNQAVSNLLPIRQKTVIRAFLNQSPMVKVLLENKN